MTLSEFTTLFESSRKSLRAYLLRLTAQPADADDLVQDTWIRASEKLASFRGESSFKTWIYAIATNLARDNRRVQQRWTEDVTDVCRAAAMKNQAFFGEAMHIRQTSAQGAFEIKEHIAFCFNCISRSLPLEQQISLLLKEVYEFKVNEISTITGHSEAMVKYYLHGARGRLIHIFEGRCALINKEGTCHQCSELNGIFNPRQQAQEELNKIEMVKAAEAGDKEALFDLRTRLVASIDPFESPAAELQLHHLEHNRQVMEKMLQENG